MALNDTDIAQWKDLNYLKDPNNTDLDAAVTLNDGSVFATTIAPPFFDIWMWFKRYDTLEYFQAVDSGAIDEDSDKSKQRLYSMVGDQKFDKEATDRAIMVSSELKFHIALPDHALRNTPGFEEDEALRAQAWSIVSDILFDPENNLHAFKLLHPTKRFTDKSGLTQPNQHAQFGKDLVVYPCVRDNKTPQEWVSLMEKISNALVEAGIPQRGEIPTGGSRQTTPLGDSPFICYRFGIDHERMHLIENQITEAAANADFKQHSNKHFGYV